MNLDSILKKVQKPTRYIGSEWGSVHKDVNGVDIRFVRSYIYLSA